jgi:hypothetical protein
VYAAVLKIKDEARVQHDVLFYDRKREEAAGTQMYPKQPRLPLRQLQTPPSPVARCVLAKKYIV